MDRRTFLRTGIGVSTAAAAGLRLPLDAIAAEPTGRGQVAHVRGHEQGRGHQAFGRHARVGAHAAHAGHRLPEEPGAELDRQRGHHARVPRREVRRGDLLRRVARGRDGAGDRGRDALRHARPRRGSERAGQPRPRGQGNAPEVPRGHEVHHDRRHRAQAGARESPRTPAPTSRRPRRSTSGSSRTPSAIPRSAAAASATSRCCSRRATSAASAPTSTRSSSAWPARSASRRATSTASA